MIICIQVVIECENIAYKCLHKEKLRMMNDSLIIIIYFDKFLLELKGGDILNFQGNYISNCITTKSHCIQIHTIVECSQFIVSYM